MRKMICVNLEQCKKLACSSSGGVHGKSLNHEASSVSTVIHGNDPESLTGGSQPSVRYRTFPQRSSLQDSLNGVPSLIMAHHSVKPSPAVVAP